MVTQEQADQYAREGYTVVSGLFSSEEVEFLREHYMSLRGQGRFPGDFDGVDPASDDPLKKFPRMIHMHRWDKTSLDWLIDKRLAEVFQVLLGMQPFAVQTMLYFKPPGARGQALHQDQFYLRAQPGMCLAAWMALDDCDEENGCMQIVPGSHEWPLLCTEKADITKSFTDVTVPVPPDAEIRPVRMKAGDVFFFHGMLIHGSYPNTSENRFRRALIGHYVTGDAERVAQYYHPALRMDGSEVRLSEAEGGGPCGVFVDGEFQMVLPDEPVAIPASE